MQIAVSGAHRTGKSTLVAALHAALPEYRTIDEPYNLLLDDGYECAVLPTVEDFEAQLERSIETLAETAGDAIYDRCPADIVAYLVAHPEGGRPGPEVWLPRCQEAMEGLDLVVYVPIEGPAASADADVDVDIDDESYRCAVDERLRGLLFGRLDIPGEVLEVTGTTPERTRQVLQWMSGFGRPIAQA